MENVKDFKSGVFHISLGMFIHLCFEKANYKASDYGKWNMV